MFVGKPDVLLDAIHGVQMVDTVQEMMLDFMLANG